MSCFRGAPEVQRLCIDMKPKLQLHSIHYSHFDSYSYYTNHHSCNDYSNNMVDNSSRGRPGEVAQRRLPRAVDHCQAGGLGPRFMVWGVYDIRGPLLRGPFFLEDPTIWGLCSGVPCCCKPLCVMALLRYPLEASMPDQVVLANVAAEATVLDLSAASFKQKEKHF